MFRRPALRAIMPMSRANSMKIVGWLYVYARPWHPCSRVMRTTSCGSTSMPSTFRPGTEQGMIWGASQRRKTSDANFKDLPCIEMLKGLGDDSPAIPVRQRALPPEESNFRILGRRTCGKHRLNRFVAALGHDESVREEAVTAVVNHHIVRHVIVERHALKAVDGFDGRIQLQTDNRRPAEARSRFAPPRPQPPESGHLCRVNGRSVFRDFGEIRHWEIGILAFGNKHPIAQSKSRDVHPAPLRQDRVLGRRDERLL